MKKRKYAITSCPTGEEVKVTVKEMTNDEVQLIKDIFFHDEHIKCMKFCCVL